MSLLYRMRSLVEVLEDYRVGLEEHLYGESGERESKMSVETKEPEDLIDSPILISEYKLTPQELKEIKNEIDRVRLFIDVFEKIINEPLSNEN